MGTLAHSTPQLGIGFYTVAEAARLLRIPAVSIRRWLAGYSYTYRGAHRTQAPLWQPELPRAEDHIELGFRDLIELRFVAAFLAEGLKLPVIRACLTTARELVGSTHPFSTCRFKTDGRSIYLESLDRFERAVGTDALPHVLGITEGIDLDVGLDEYRSQRQVLDLRDQQYVFANVVERTFRDLDVDADSVVRWRPFRGKSTIVVDPRRAFGQPITNEGMVPTVAIAGAVTAEGSEKRVAFLYDVPLPSVRDAVRFEQELRAA